MVVLDTNILIDHLRRKKSIDSVLSRFLQDNPNENIAISILTIQELFTGQSSREPQIEQIIFDLIDPYKKLEYSFQIAKLAGELSRDSKSQPQFADAAIAATCILNDAKLLTLNQKDFTGIKELEIIKN